VDNGATTYAYDADGQRVAKTTGSVTTDFIYDREGHVKLYNSSPASGSSPFVEVYVGGLHLGTYVLNSAITDTIFYYNHSDWLGTERARINLSGSVCETITSLPFGDGQTMRGTCVDISTMHFTGKERDTESGLDNFGARYNASSMGRFMTPDWADKPTSVPYANFGDPQSLNLYSYVRNNPLSRTDPTGHYEADRNGCNGNYNAKCEKKYRKRINRFELARKKDLNSKDPNVRAAAAAYGDLDEKNGVHVGFVDLGAGIKGEVGALSSGKGKLIDVEVTINSGLKGTSLQETVAHEGSHVGDDINFLTSYNFGTGKYDSGADFTGRQTEFRGYQAGAGVSHEHGFGPNDAQKINDYITDHYEQNYLNNNYFPDNANFPQ
jgi:RHS repeat-associated protein